MLSKATLLELLCEAVKSENVDNFQKLYDDLYRRLQFHTTEGVCQLDEKLVSRSDLETLLNMLIATSETLGEGLGLEASTILRGNQKLLLKIIQGRYHDLETKLRQINELSKDDSDTYNGFKGLHETSSALD